MNWAINGQHGDPPPNGRFRHAQRVISPVMFLSVQCQTAAVRMFLGFGLRILALGLTKQL
jgi:hypothetical protein